MASSLRPRTAGRIQALTILRSAVILLALFLAPVGGAAWAQGRSGAPDPSSFAQAALLPETHEGRLLVLHEDRDPGSRYRYFLHTASEQLELQFPDDAPGLVTGDHVRVTGVRTGGVLALSSSGSVSTLSSGLPNTLGPQKTLVILVNFVDKLTQPYSVATAQGVMATTSNFDLENSFGQTSLTSVVDSAQAADVRGWFTIALSSTVCDYSTLASQAKSAAAAAGVDLSVYGRLVYAFPQNACTWWGLGTVGGNPSSAWINGTFSLKVVGHEMGHGLGLYHSRALDCGSAVLGAGCTVIEYGDPFDIMGNPSSGHFNAFQKERLGWLNYGSSPPITTVQAEGIYTLDPYESAPGTSGNPKALKIVQSTNATTAANTWYYVEYRQALGFDSFLSSNANVLNGVVVRLGTDQNANSSNLLDLTPGTSSWSDAALDVGQSYTDSTTGTTITPMWVGSTAGVSVTFGSGGGGSLCVRANPVEALSPSATQWVMPGTATSWTVTVTSMDSSSCSASTFGLEASVPAGWSAAFSPAQLALAPGATGLATLTVVSPSIAPSAVYTIPVTATNTANASSKATGAVTEALASSLAVIISFDRNPPVYTKRSQSVTITTFAGMTDAVTGQKVGAPGAGVTVTIRKPNQSTLTATGTTDTSGNFVFKFKPGRKDPTGTWQVQAVTTLNGISGITTADFTLQ